MVLVLLGAISPVSSNFLVYPVCVQCQDQSVVNISKRKPHSCALPNDSSAYARWICSCSQIFAQLKMCRQPMRRSYGAVARRRGSRTHVRSETELTILQRLCRWSSAQVPARWGAKVAIRYTYILLPEVTWHRGINRRQTRPGRQDKCVRHFLNEWNFHFLSLALTLTLTLTVTLSLKLTISPRDDHAHCSA